MSDEKIKTIDIATDQVGIQIESTTDEDGNEGFGVTLVCGNDVPAELEMVAHGIVSTMHMAPNILAICAALDHQTVADPESDISLMTTEGNA